MTDDEIRDAIATAVPSHYADPEAAELADALLPVVRRAQAAALRDTAHAWQWGAWGNTPRHQDQVADRIGAAQYVTDWLRARADALGGQP